MKPVDQTSYTPEDGNCFQACVASIFELPLEVVPHFMIADNYRKVLTDWLSLFGLWSISLDVKSCIEANHIPQAYHIISGPSPNHANCWHSVVGYKGKIVHDPHPDKKGLKSEEVWELFVHDMNTPPRSYKNA